MHVSLAIYLVVVFDKEIFNIIVMRLRLAVLNKTKQTVRHDKAIWQNHELRLARLDHFTAPVEVEGGKVADLHMLLEVIFMHHLFGLQIYDP